jgi:transcriptional regulator with GAF, ATPase, and Fis domain
MKDLPAGRYVSKKLLGEGGAGRVWLVDDLERPGHELALKEMTGVASPQHEEAFRREFATLACLHHPGLVEVEEFDGTGGPGLQRFTLEYIEGRHIVDAVHHEGRESIVGFVVEALRAIGFMHDFDLVHRDLKPANVLVRDRPKLGCRVVLVDFGLALSEREPSVEMRRAAGTLPYLAPEILSNAAASRRSDLYALGAIVHEAVFGSLPGEGSRRPNAACPPGLAAWVDDLLAAEPTKRPAGAAAALARLNDACGTAHPLETPATRAARLLSGPPAERQEAVTTIERALESEAGPKIVWLCGEAGSGKSRILRWLEAGAIRRGRRTIAGIGSLGVSLGELQSAAGALVLLDEAHAASAETVDRLARLSRERGSSEVQVVAALRQEAIVRPSLRDLLLAAGTVESMERVELRPLDEGAIRAMASRATGSAVSDERVSWLLGACEGSAARAEALIVDGAWERGGRSRESVLRAVPGGRLDMISARATAWLRAVAVLASRVHDAHAARLSGLSGDDVRAAAIEVAAAGLVHRRDGAWHLESGALRDAVIRRTEPERSRALHREAAELLTREGDADASRLARLWAGAGETERAVAAASAAAEAYERASDPAAAASSWADALRFLGRGRRGRHAIRSQQADALLRAGRHADAVRACGGARYLAGDEPARVAALVMQASALVLAGRFRRALVVAEDAAHGAEAIGDRLVFAQARRLLGVGLGRLGREVEAVAVLEEARRLFQARGDARGEADTLHTLAACRSRLGDPRAEGELVEAIAIYRRLASADPLLRKDGQDLKARVGLAVMRSRAGRYDDAAAILDEVRAEAASRGNLGLQEVALSKSALNAIDLGRLDRAIGMAEQAADLALHLADQNLILVNACALADARIRCGRAGEAAAGLRQALGMPLTQAEPENTDYARMLLADAWNETGGGDEREIRSLLARSLAGCRERGKRRALLMGLVIEMERRAPVAGDDPFEPARAEYDSVCSASEPVEPEIRIRAALARAAYDLTRGDPLSAHAAADEAAEAARAIGWPAFEARACALASAACERAGRMGEADERAAAGRALLARAAERIEDDRVRRDFLLRPVYAPLQSEPRAEARNREGRLGALYDMIRALNSENDPEALLETILDLALRAVSATRGMVFLREEREGPGQGSFAVHLTRNLENETLHDAESYSRRIVESAGGGRSILALDAGTDERFRDLASVSLYQIRSLMCVPLRSRGRVIGTVYLDSRTGGRLFTKDDLRFVEALADQAALAIENTRLRVRLERENRQLAAAAEARTSFAQLVGRSPGMRAIFSLIEKVAGTDLPVLIRGESGTGKELVARAVHANGPRRRRPFLGENCAAVPETLLESELFGHVRGAFTGADRPRPGLFEQADGGTLFLDEVGDMSPAMQVRLLRVVEEGSIRRVGGEKTVPVDVRLITATHRDLGAAIKSGQFRHDLLYRLQVLTIEIPPLRERPGDIPLLVAHVLERIAAERRRAPWVVDDEAMALFERYRWPGNVRELQNALQRLSLLAGERSISARLIASDPVLQQALIPEARSAAIALTLKSGEKSQILQAIAAAKGNRSRAAGLLGVSRATLYRKLRQHAI